jgi:hypothetical protein
MHIPLLTRWLHAVCSQDLHAVLSLYTSDAVLLGTFSKELKQGQELRAYFRKFLSRSDLCGEIHTAVPQALGGGSLVVSGFYTFRWIDAAGPTEAHARYTFVFVPVGEGHLILTQHSSLVPA